MNTQHRRLILCSAVLLITMTVALFGAGGSLASRERAPGDTGPQPYGTLTPPPPTLPAAEAAKLVPVAQQYTHPDARPLADEPLDARALLAEPHQFDGYSVALQGKVISVNSVQRILSSGWADAYVVTIDDGTAWIPVLYRGNVGAFDVGDSLLATGAFVADGAAVHADAIAALESPTRWHDDIPQGLIPAMIAVVVLGLGALGILLTRQAIGLVTVCGILLGSLTACQLQIETVVHSDGSATTAVRFSETLENTDFLREIPGMRRYIASWLAQYRDQGLTVENWVAGDVEHFVLQQHHQDLASLSVHDDASAGDSWVYATSYRVGDAQCYRYLARVDPQVLYTTPPGTESAVVNEINKYLSRVAFTYAVTLPGRIEYSNASVTKASRAEWRLDMRQPNELVAESCKYSIVTTPNWRWGWVAVAGGATMDVGLLLLVLRKRQFGRRSRFSGHNVVEEGYDGK